jgi:hypothetical protein
MAKRGVAAGAGDIPLSRFGALVAQLESVVASARQKPPDALLCFDLLSELSSALDEAPKVTLLSHTPSYHLPDPSCCGIACAYAIAVRAPRMGFRRAANGVAVP